MYKKGDRVIIKSPFFGGPPLKGYILSATGNLYVPGPHGYCVVIDDPNFREYCFSSKTYHYYFSEKEIELEFPLKEPTMKTFFESDDLLFEHITSEFSSGNMFRRVLLPVHASLGVTWEQIASEVHSLCSDSSYSRQGEELILGDKILTTCMVEYPTVVVALTLKGFLHNVDKELPPHTGREYPYEYFKYVEYLARELVASRDFEAFRTSMDGKDHDKNLHDFLPRPL